MKSNENKPKACATFKKLKQKLFHFDIQIVFKAYICEKVAYLLFAVFQTFIQ